MKLLHEFHKPEVITKAAEEIRRRADPIRHYRIMEVCGGHTHAICSFGLKDVLPTPWLTPEDGGISLEAAWHYRGFNTLESMT
jgi:Hydrogenase formation hypA family